MSRQTDRTLAAARERIVWLTREPGRHERRKREALEARAARAKAKADERAAAGVLAALTEPDPEAA